MSFGFNNLKQGCQIGLPVSYFAKNKDELLELSPPNGFSNYLGQSFKYKDIEDKLGTDKLNEFYESMLLSDDAKLFALGHAMTQSDHFFISCASVLVDIISYCAAYIVCYTRSRHYKMQYNQRKRLYLVAICIAISVSTVIRFYLKSFNDTINEKRTCNLGLDCAEGALEFYEKMLKRNNVLRHVIDNGASLIDELGNPLYNSIRVPFTDYQFYIKNFGISITNRKNICEKELLNLISKLNKENEMKHTELNIETEKNEKTSEDKELKIFRDIRLKLESLKMSNQK